VVRFRNIFALELEHAMETDALLLSYPDGRQYGVAVFTRSKPGSDDAAISRAIGTATAQAVTALDAGNRRSRW
jgi:beta-lactamase class A